MLEQDGFEPALEDMLQKTLGLAGIRYEYVFRSKEKRISAESELGIYRICQELVGNILKHSGATQVSLNFYERNQKFFLLVEDNGKGFDESTLKETGLGLQNIRARASVIKGEITFESSPGKGTTVILALPK
jgi:signal transduction histidine kinase